MRTTKLLLLLAAILLPSNGALALNATYNPHWKIGDHWNVRVTFPVSLKRAGPPGAPLPSQNVDYAYAVIRQITISGKPGWMVSVTPQTPGYNSWILDYDANSLALVRVQQGLLIGSVIVTPNPFGTDAWMPKLSQFDNQIVHDTVRLPDANHNQTRTLTAPQTSTPDFTQSVTFLAHAVTTTLSRTDPLTAKPHKTVIVWTPGKKWWTSATTTLGPDTLVSAKLL